MGIRLTKENFKPGLKVMVTDFSNYVSSDNYGQSLKEELEGVVLVTGSLAEDCCSVYYSCGARSGKIACSPYLWRLEIINNRRPNLKWL